MKKQKPNQGRLGWVMRNGFIILVVLFILAMGSNNGHAQTGPYTIWNNSVVPAIVAASDGSAVELGVKFRSDVAGYVTGLRFYKSSSNTGTHVGNLWTSTG